MDGALIKLEVMNAVWGRAHALTFSDKAWVNWRNRALY